MDFGSLLHEAYKNNKSANKDVKYYKTKFEPPKKEVKTKTNLSSNIQKYLQKRDEEERKKAEEEKRKKEELLALRSQDKKSFKRVQTMLKRTKSANKSVMEDAIDDVNTAVTMAGSQQCDEDDYGYVSQEASALYDKLMDKYSRMPAEEAKFPQGKKPVVKDLNAAKDRVKAALQKEEEEAMMPHKRKRKSKFESNDEEAEQNNDESKNKLRDTSPVNKNLQISESKTTKIKKHAPPPLNFSDLLKIAEKKQFEPIQIEKKVKKDDDERPMTKKQRLEYERERERKERKLEHENMKIKQKSSSQCNASQKTIKPMDSSKKLSAEEMLKKSANVWSKPCNLTLPKRNTSGLSEHQLERLKQINKIPSPLKPIENKPKTDGRVEKMPQMLSKSKPSTLQAKANKSNTSSTLINCKSEHKSQRLPASRSLGEGSSSKKEISKNTIPKQNSKSSLTPKQFPPSDLKPKQFPPNDLRPKSFPPKDVRGRHFPPPDVKRRPNKPSCIQDSSEDEYDSEMDDFIDDGMDINQEQISGEIRSIFGYDKNRYIKDDEDDECMESNFGQIDKEESISLKLGAMEDYRELMREQAEKKRIKQRKLEMLKRR